MRKAHLVAEAERDIVRCVVQSAITCGYYVEVDDGGKDTAPCDGNDVVSVLAAMFSTDIERVMFHVANARGRCSGWAQFVYGNDGYDVLSDYSDNAVTRAIVEPAEKLADAWERKLTA